MEANITGWQAFPVGFVESISSTFENYVGLAITGRCGPIDVRRAKCEMRDSLGPSGAQYPIWKGMYFDATTWDGSDLFMAKGVYDVFATDRVKSLFDRQGVTNVQFTALPDVEMLKPLLDALDAASR